VLEYLSRYFEITLFFYNPNIFSLEEYEKRAGEVQRLLTLLQVEHPIRFVSVGWEHERFEDTCSALANEPEGGARCMKCFELRLRRAAELAREGNYDYFTTTLSISPLKNAARLNEIGEKVGAELGVKHLPSDFKKKGGYARSVELSREYGLYRQDYCGCLYSFQSRHKKEEP
jgi:hypothetical protein